MGDGRIRLALEGQSVEASSSPHRFPMPSLGLPRGPLLPTLPMFLCSELSHWSRGRSGGGAVVRGEEAQGGLGRWERGLGSSLGWSFQRKFTWSPEATLWASESG